MGTIKVDRLKAVLQSINSLVQKQVLVGVPDSTAGNRDDDAPLSNAEIGYIQEMGSPANNIPARPFLVPGVSDSLPKATAQLERAATAALEGDLQAVERRLSSAGLEAQNSALAKINSNIQPKLADATIAARLRRGVTRTNTLIDTGGLRNSIIYVIRRKK